MRVKKNFAALVFLLVSIRNINATLPVKINFFYSSTCEECLEVKNVILPEIIRVYQSSVVLGSFELGDTNNYGLLMKLEKQYGAEAKNPPPTIFVEDRLLDGDKEIKSGLEKTIRDYIAKEKPATIPLIITKPLPKKTTGQNVRQKPQITGGVAGAVEEKLSYIGVTAVIGAGLIDGLNLCAFGTLIMLILYLTFAGYKRSQLLVAGLAYTSAVFLVYLLIGVGLLEFVKQMKALPAARTIINVLIGSIAIVLAFLSFSDYLKIRRGKSDEITLKLPKQIMSKIKSLIWNNPNKSYYFLTSFMLGCLIGALEFPCTGQIYFPIVIAIREMPGLRLHAFLFLLLYNLMFILPLVIVFILTYLGTNSDRFVQFLEKRSSTIKFLTSIVFFVLGAGLIFIGLR